jgi:hypothetical protein
MNARSADSSSSSSSSRGGSNMYVLFAVVGTRTYVNINNVCGLCMARVIILPFILTTQYMVFIYIVE